jgi:hypothetical protein
LRLRALDARDRLSGRSDQLVPPRRLQFVGEGFQDLVLASA